MPVFRQALHAQTVVLVRKIQTVHLKTRLLEEHTFRRLCTQFKPHILYLSLTGWINITRSLDPDHPGGQKWPKKIEKNNKCHFWRSAGWSLLRADGWRLFLKLGYPAWQSKDKSMAILENTVFRYFIAQQSRPAVIYLVFTTENTPNCFAQWIELVKVCGRRVFSMTKITLVVKL